MVDYREILRLLSLKYNYTQIAETLHSSRNTIREVGKLADEKEISWPLEKELTNHKEVKESLVMAADALAKSGACYCFRLAKGAIHNEGAWKKRLPSALDCFELTRMN